MRDNGEATNPSGRLEPVDLGADPRPQHPPNGARLVPAAGSERNVALPLQPVLGVIGRLAVADENEAVGEGRQDRDLLAKPVQSPADLLY